MPYTVYKYFCFHKIKGFKNLLLNNGYEGEITYLVQSDHSNNSDNNDNKNEFSSDKIKCSINCSHCMQNIQNKQKQFNENPEKIYNENDYTINRTNNDYELPKSSNDLQNSQQNSKNTEWKNIQGKFFMINCANICCASSRSLNGLSPYCHLGDGYNHIVLIRHTNIVNNIRLLLTLVNRKGDIVSTYIYL